MINFKKILALVLSITMVLGLGVAAFAVDQEHIITITNSDANGDHTYEAYQVFKGNLNATSTTLSDVIWGEGVNGDGILTALIAANTATGNALNGKLNSLTAGDSTATPPVEKSTAAEVAKAIATLGDNSAALDEVARIINNNLVSSKKISFTGSKTANYTATVPSDGYYFIKDTTTTLPDGDTASKFMLSVVKDVTINAKDTSFKPDKEITGGPTNVKEGSARIGDTVTFQVAIPVPDTTNYKKDFWFVMDDTLPTGMTFTGVTSIKTYAAEDIDVSANYKVKSTATPTGTLTTPVADANSVGYTLTVKTGSGDYGAYTVPSQPVTAEGGQKIKVTFNEFKKFAETEYATEKNHIGEYVVVEYTAVVNDDAVFGATGNKNEVEFTYSNNPNEDYDGDNPDGTKPTGKTPKDKVEQENQALSLFTFTVPNNPGVELPSTGGRGTAAFTIAGITLVITSGAVLTSRCSRRKKD